MVSITAHTLVKNESRYAWFSAMSVMEYVDKMLLWDTGSTDGTAEILKEIKRLYPQKVDLRLLGDVDINEFTAVRSEMLNQTKTDWFLIVDGDEVWWEDGIKKVHDLIQGKGKTIETIVTRCKNLVGDIYHFQHEKYGLYHIDGIRGHLNIRAINRKIAGLHISKPHGTQGFFDAKNKLIQERSLDKRTHLLDRDAYLHFTNMPRSIDFANEAKVPKRSQKYRYDLGIQLPLDYYYPEVFFRPYPSQIPSPWIPRSLDYVLRSNAVYLPRLVKSTFLPKKVGY